MTRDETVFRSRRVVLPSGMAPASVAVRGERIAEVRPYAHPVGGAELVDVGDDVLLPGLVDTHVHLNEPGRTAWEGIASGTRAAAAGGVTTLVDMPLNSVPATTSLAGLRAKVAAAEGATRVDLGFWGGVVPGNQGDLAALRAAGVLGFKCFLAPSGVDEFPHVDGDELRRALPVIAAQGVPLLVHAELPAALERAAGAAAGGDPRRYATYLATRPPGAEREAIDLLIALARESGARIHVVHLADAGALPALRAARDEGLPLTVESCPHYLHFAAEEIADGATAWKCAPPIRSADHRERLWEALAAGEIDLVATDHSPCPPEMKRTEDGDFLRAWGGIASLQLGLSVVWHGARRRGISPWHLAQWMCRAPARLAGLEASKGEIAPGRDADLVVWDPDAESTVVPESLHHRHKLTPYAGLTLPGVVRATYLRGRCVYRDGHHLGPAAGRLLLGTDR